MDNYPSTSLSRDLEDPPYIPIAKARCFTPLFDKSRSSIQKIEKGENDIPQSKIKAFAVALNTTPEYLMGWTSSGNTAVGDDEEKLLNDYRTLDNGKKQTLFSMLAFLKSSQGTNTGNVVLSNKNSNNVFSNGGNVIMT